MQPIQPSSGRRSRKGRDQCGKMLHLYDALSIRELGGITGWPLLPLAGAQRFRMRAKVKGGDAEVGMTMGCRGAATSCGQVRHCYSRANGRGRLLVPAPDYFSEEQSFDLWEMA